MLNDPSLNPHPEEARSAVSKEEAEAGMAEMSEKFHALGAQVYVDAEKVKESNKRRTRPPPDFPEKDKAALWAALSLRGGTALLACGHGLTNGGDDEIISRGMSRYDRPGYRTGSGSGRRTESAGDRRSDRCL